MDSLLAIVIITALIALNGLFVAAEFAIVAAPRMALERRAQAGHAVAAAVIAGLEAERFLILPHPEVADFVVRKAGDRDGWIAAMQRLQARLGLSK